MGLESTSYISGLVKTNPVLADPVHEGANHIWLIKKVLKTVFPGSGGQGFAKAITAVEDDLNKCVGLGVRTNTVATDLTSMQASITALQTSVSTLTTNLQKTYPVGSIYINASNSANPQTIIGFGTWSRFGKGRMLISQDDANALCNTAEETGGYADSVVVDHGHTGVTGLAGDGGSGTTAAAGSGVGVAGSGFTHSHGVTIDNAGVSGTNRNYPPYITVYMWKRTA